jgi:hypothetical protein
LTSKEYLTSKECLTGKECLTSQECLTKPHMPQVQASSPLMLRVFQEIVSDLWVKGKEIMYVTRISCSSPPLAPASPRRPSPFPPPRALTHIHPRTTKGKMKTLEDALRTAEAAAEAEEGKRALQEQHR